MKRVFLVGTGASLILGVGLSLLRERLIFMGVLPWWSVSLVLGMVCALTVEEFLKGMRAGGALRIGVVLSLGWIALQPKEVEVRETETRARVLFLEDVSQSMALEGRGKSAKNHDEVRAFWAGLGAEVDVVERRFAQNLLKEGEREPGEGSQKWRTGSAIGVSVREAVEEWGPEQVAGVVLFSDGQDTSGRGLAEVGSWLSEKEVPVFAAVPEEVEVTRDAALSGISAPQVLHEGERMTVQVAVRLTKLQGKSVDVHLWRDGEIQATQTLRARSEEQEVEVLLSDEPEEGEVNYRVTLEIPAEDSFPENNELSFKVGVSDARTHVLLVDSLPRWEFRYLRNLLHRRDHSVQLQWVLTQPDEVGGQEKGVVPASVKRAFGDSQADVLPATEAGWRGFDVIILGDVGRSVLGEEEWKILRGCVRDRGATVITIAGPRKMPHAFPQSWTRGVLPVDYQESGKTFFKGGEPFSMRMNPVEEGRVFAGLEDGMFQEWWQKPPTMRWRHPSVIPKPGARVVLYAGSVEEEQDLSGSDRVDLRRLSALNRIRESNALLIKKRSGKGRTAFLATDRTWRLRQGAGDRYHHAFWKGLIDWGAGPRLRGGSERRRLGTERLVYLPQERVTVSAALRDETLVPERGLAMTAMVRGPKGLQVEVVLTEDPERPGYYHGVTGPFAQEGAYKLTLQDQEQEAGVTFHVRSDPARAELADPRVDVEGLEAFARASGGAILTEEDAESFGRELAARRNVRTETVRTPLWQLDWLFLLILVFSCADWALRRREGLR